MPWESKFWQSKKDSFKSGFNFVVYSLVKYNKVWVPKKYVKSTLKFYYENLINNKLSKLDQKSKLYLFSNLKQNLSVESYLSISNYEYRKLLKVDLILLYIVL
jgi:hypothetical protein